MGWKTLRIEYLDEMWVCKLRCASGSLICMLNMGLEWGTYYGYCRRCWFFDPMINEILMVSSCCLVMVFWRFSCYACLEHLISGIPSCGSCLQYVNDVFVFGTCGWIIGWWKSVNGS